MWLCIKLVLRSYVSTEGRRRLYQEGPVAAMRPPTELFKLYCGGLLPAGTAMFCGGSPFTAGSRRRKRSKWNWKIRC
jgi:hypothetical protein